MEKIKLKQFKNAIKSREKQLFITLSLANKSGPIFIGLSRERTKNEFVWDDGNILEFQNWIPGEPNEVATFRPHVCVQLVSSLDIYGGWNDTQCNMKIGYSCEKPYGNNYFHTIFNFKFFMAWR